MNSDQQTEQFHLEQARKARDKINAGQGDADTKRLMRFHTKEAMSLNVKQKRKAPKTVEQAVDKGLLDGTHAERVKSRMERMDKVIDGA